MPRDVEASLDTYRTESLADHGLIAAVVVSLLPVIGTAFAMLGFFVTVGPSPIPNTATLVCGVVNIVVVVGLYRQPSASERRAVFRYDWPSVREILVAISLAVVAVGLVGPIVVQTASVFGERGEPSVPAFTSAFGALIVAGSSVVVAPIVEEVLFRGYRYGALRSQYEASIAVVGSSMVFGVIHIFLSGLPGVVEAFVIGVGFALLRNR